MKKLIMIVFALWAGVSWADKVKVEILVTDYENHPIKGAKVTFRTRATRKAPFWRPAEDADYVARTDGSGLAQKSFHCWSSRFECYVSADGYYDEVLPCQTLKSEPADPYSVRLIETTRNLQVSLRPRINPIPMYAHKKNLEWTAFGTNQWNSCGYDLMLDDWLPPKGKGLNADFIITNIGTVDDDALKSTCILEFKDGAGAYIVSDNSAGNHWIVYTADTNACYKSEFVATRSQSISGSEEKEELLLQAGQCLVLRTRVIKNIKGEIVSCNYSKIYGPMSIAGIFRFAQSCYNPNANDPNLEFDCNRNLVRRTCGAFRP